MKLRIQKLYVNKCGPLRDALIDFGERPLTLIAGANGSGKTTILELIYKLLKGGTSYPNGLLLEFEYESERFIHIQQRPSSQVPEKLLGQNPIDKESYDIVWNIDREEITNISHTYSKENPSLVYFPHFRFIPPGIQRKSLDKIYDIKQFTRKIETPNQFRDTLDAYLIWLDYAYLSDFVETQDFLNTYALFGKKIIGIDKPNLKAIVKTDEGDEHYLEELSSGEQNILILALQIHRYATPGSVILIDELENSLHPQFQFTLGKMIKKLADEKDYQFIMTTHAPAFLEIFGAENTIILSELNHD